MSVQAWLLAAYGPEAYGDHPQAMSRGEQVVYAELDRRIGRGSYVAHWRPGDIPFTPGREAREVDVLIPALELCIFVNSAFTHPDPLADQYVAFLMRMYGLHSEFVWDYEILPEMGGDVRERLNRIDGLRFFGQAVDRDNRPSGFTKKFRQPPRILPFDEVSYGF